MIKSGKEFEDNEFNASSAVSKLLVFMFDFSRYIQTSFEMDCSSSIT